jgi:asparagine synthase (glutamine-hydrolysing)
MVDDILTKVDIAGMANSLEIRVPFLDRKVVELAFSIDSQHHYKNQELKYLLKKAGKKYLSEHTLYKEKKGFSVPSVSWLKNNYEHNILNGLASRDRIWDKKYLKKLLSGHLHEDQKWLLYNFERWYAINFHGKMDSLEYTFTDRIKHKLSSFLD